MTQFNFVVDGFFWFIVCISSFPKKKLKNAQEEGYGCAWCLELTLTEHRSLGGVGWGRGGGHGKTTSLKRSGMLFIVYSLRKWTWVSQLNEQPKELKKNLEKFRLDRESNSDRCNNLRLVQIFVCFVLLSFPVDFKREWKSMRRGLQKNNLM